MKYDTKEGKPRYYKFSEPFLLKDYLNKEHEFVNCYDQASAVQVFIASFGVEVHWIFMKPFGYIKSTRLVGVNELCNNPFYDKNGSSPLVNTYSEKRTGFGNHAFCGTSKDFKTNQGFILDACAGPHIGDETPSTYISNSIEFAKTKENYKYVLITPKEKMETFLSFMNQLPYDSFSPISQLE